MNIENKGAKLYVIGLSFEKSNQEVRNLYSLSKNKIEALLVDAKESGIDSLVVLSTCNRTEIFGYVAHPYIIIELLCRHTEGSVDHFMKYAYILKQEEAVQHLFELSVGIKSQILGDYEIVGQLKIAAKLSKAHQLLDGFLDRLLSYVIQASKATKNATTISGGTTSTSYAGIQYLKDKFGDLKDKKVTVLGAGDIGKSTVKNLLEYSACTQITVINRTIEKAMAISIDETRVVVEEFGALKEVLAINDVLFVCSSAPNHLVHQENTPLVNPFTIIDLSLPNNVDYQLKNFTNVDLMTLDDLSLVRDNTLEARKQEIPKAIAIIDSYKKKYSKWVMDRKYTPVIHGFKKQLLAIQETELKSLSKSNPAMAEEAFMVSDKVIQKITNKFANHLKSDPKMANQSIEVIKEVFNITID
ncbi:glutamyl-tRNA reductase [Putridiphycobacter roseus]|uniref:Glutamyl-tRNA reductase n=1 Tax=Putridiphycobacter roseus TaxID=2219161 RepID=A0A2W1N6L3_9FLAO|nr:glutamyl-tRNA reductase [Putridiphycobacter roseus]PZE18791.1 glutamyl-tRNA reductase [Putridiphycobacter roseus]